MEDIRWQQRLENYGKALGKLNENIEFIKGQFVAIDFQNKDAILSSIDNIPDIYKQGLIQSFEFTHELAWNVMKDFALDQGNPEIRGSKDATRYSAKVNLLENAQLWMDMIPNRNRTSHTYNAETANMIFVAIIISYNKAFENFNNKMLSLIDQ